MNRPLRIFFGQFQNASSHVATTNGDQVFPDFLLGTYEGTSSVRLHSRQPSGSAGDISSWDEYLDLKYSGLGFEVGNTVGRYKNIAGVESQIFWVDDALLFDPTNVLSLQTDGIEFTRPTRRLSLPYPKPAPNPVQPELYASNSVDKDSATGFYKFWVTIWDAAGLLESSPSIGSVVGYNATVDCDVVIKFSGALTQTFSLYRAEVIWDTFRQEWVLKSLPRVLDNYNQATLTATPHTFNADLCDIVAEPDATPNVIMEQPALNDARARIKFDYLRRRRFASGVPSQRWLLLNTDTHEYFKGVVGALSDVFLAGWSFQDAKNVQISVLVSEQGSFVDDALTDPNEDDYFIPFSRSIV